MIGNLRQLVAATLALTLFEPSSLAQAADDNAPAQHRIKEDGARTGTLFVRSGITSSDVALNRTYSELSPEDKATVHGWYEYIAPGDEPPYPVKGLAPIYKAIDRARNIAPAHGEMFLAVTVGADGKAKDVQVLNSPGHDMTQFVASVMLMTSFKPAVCSNKACEMQFPLVVTFKQIKKS
jgi:hypothetical protein